eukprot:2507106-Alexandrium_andersonii.AAC.1
MRGRRAATSAKPGSPNRWVDSKPMLFRGAPSTPVAPTTCPDHLLLGSRAHADSSGLHDVET